MKTKAVKMEMLVLMMWQSCRKVWREELEEELTDMFVCLYGWLNEQMDEKEEKGKHCQCK